MKIHFDVDLTPSEFRAVFGLPDLEPLNEEITEKLREKILTSIDNYDPMNFLAPYLSENMRTMEGFQRAMWEALSTQNAAKKED